MLCRAVPRWRWWRGGFKWQAPLHRCMVSAAMQMAPGSPRDRHRLLRPAAVCLLLAFLALTLFLIAQERLQLPLPCQIAPRLAEGGAASADGAAAPQHGGKGSDSRRACDSPPTVTPSQWAESCSLLTDVCVDQGSVILYGEEHRMGPGSPGTAPYLIEPALDWKKYIFLHRNSVRGCQLQSCFHVCG